MLLSPEVVVERLNRLLTGWANYFILGQMAQLTRRLIGMPNGGCAGGSVVSTRLCAFPDKRLWQEYDLTRLRSRAASLPWAKASSESRMREICIR